MQLVAITEKCANFNDATEAAILTLNFNLTSADHAFNRPKKTKNRLNDLCFVVCVNLVRVIYRCGYMTGNRSRFSKYSMVGSPVFSINLTNRLIPAKPNYLMSIKNSHATLKCFIDLKSSVWFTQEETMFCDT